MITIVERRWKENKWDKREINLKYCFEKNVLHSVMIEHSVITNIIFYTILLGKRTICPVPNIGKRHWMALWGCEKRKGSRKWNGPLMHFHWI